MPDALDGSVQPSTLGRYANAWAVSVVSRPEERGSEIRRGDVFSCIPAIALFLTVFAAGSAAAQGQAVNDYPTSARADYVFACTAANGGSRLVLEHCSCSIDVIASVIP